MILQWYLLFTGASHYSMLIPQPSILSGKKRPDFICFIPLSKFQYQKVAILVDRSGKDPFMLKAESTEYQEEAFIVKRFLVDQSKSYFKIGREIKNWIESL